MRMHRAIVAVLLLHTLLSPLLAQEPDVQPYFSLTSDRTYLPGEKVEVAVYSHNVNALQFRIYRVNDPIKFFSQLQEMHSFGGQAPRMPKQAHTWLERFHAWKHRIWAWVRDFIRALEKHGELKRIPFEVDPDLEITEFADRSVGRRRADPEPRHARRQHRQRLAGG